MASLLGVCNNPQALRRENPGWVLVGGDALHIGGGSHSVVSGTKSFGEGEKMEEREGRTPNDKQEYSRYEKVF